MAIIIVVVVKLSTTTLVERGNPRYLRVLAPIYGYRMGYGSLLFLVRVFTAINTVAKIW